jgi:hypothetical protein
LDQLIRLEPDYRRQGNGTPYFWYPRGNTGYGLHPTPAVTDVDIVQIIYVALPPRVTGSQDFFYGPHGSEDAYICFAKLRASEKDAFGEGKARIPSLQAEWKDHLTELKRNVDDLAERELIIVGEEGAYGDVIGDGRVPWRTNVTAP